jgi:hypothetical protein
MKDWNVVNAQGCVSLREVHLLQNNTNLVCGGILQRQKSALFLGAAVLIVMVLFSG